MTKAELIRMNCRICDKVFYAPKNPRGCGRPLKTKGKLIRKYGCVTCSHECSRENSRLRTDRRITERRLSQKNVQN